MNTSAKSTESRPTSYTSSISSISSIPITVVSLPPTPPATFIPCWQEEFLRFASAAIVDAAENLLYDNFLLCEDLEPALVQKIIAKYLIDRLIQMSEDLDYTIRVDDQFTEALKKAVDDHNSNCDSSPQSEYNTASILGAH
jgi:hypothetical protein